ncbi:MAG: hypothetical protein MUO76_17515 [Anaerolineaceae bacterium]|nr:hypothetical protein [Anaerolineaceae bacterium]
MSEQTKSCISLIFFICIALMPLIGLAIGWVGWDFKTGATAGVIIFIILFLVTCIFLLTVKDPSWITASVPALFGIIYTFSLVSSRAPLTMGSYFQLAHSSRMSSGTEKERGPQNGQSCLSCSPQFTPSSAGSSPDL